MSIIRTDHSRENPYALISKSLLDDNSISWAAKGLLVYLLSKPNNWNVKVAHLVKNFHLEGERGSGEKAIYKLLNELIDKGYCERSQNRKDNGLFSETEYVVFEIKKVKLKIESPHSPEGNADVRNAAKGKSVSTSESSPCYNKYRKLINTESTTTNPVSQNKEAPSAPVVVFFPSLNKLDIQDTLKSKFTMKYTEEEIDIAVKRCLAWKNRENDEIAIHTVLKQATSWTDVLSEEEIQNKNKTFFESLKHLDGKKLGHVQVTVGINYIEFVSGMKYIQYSTDDLNFESLVLGYIKKIKDIQKL